MEVRCLVVRVGDVVALFMVILFAIVFFKNLIVALFNDMIISLQSLLTNKGRESGTRCFVLHCTNSVHDMFFLLE